MRQAQQAKNKAELQVFFDGKCVVCSKEIDLYRRKDSSNKIEFVDISAPQFDATAEGLDPKTVQKVFHVKDSRGQWHRGVDGFIKIWETLGIWGPLSSVAKSSVARPVFDLGYHIFTKVRPFLPRKQCSDGYCEV